MRHTARTSFALLCILTVTLSRPSASEPLPPARHFIELALSYEVAELCGLQPRGFAIVILGTPYPKQFTIEALQDLVCSYSSCWSLGPEAFVAGPVAAEKVASERLRGPHFFLIAVSEEPSWLNAEALTVNAVVTDIGDPLDYGSAYSFVIVRSQSGWAVEGSRRFKLDQPFACGNAPGA